MQKIIKGLTVYKIGYWGIGIASLPDGKKVLIKGGALPWSIVDVRVVKNKKDYIEAHLLEIRKYDEKIINGTPLCAHFFSPIWEQNQPAHKTGCGGCKWQVMTYESQLALKESIIKDAFSKLSKTHQINFLPIVGSPLEKGYRNKIEFSFGVYKQLNDVFKKAKKSWTPEQELLDQGLEKYAVDSDFNIGFHKQWEFSKIVDVDSCGLISEKANQVFTYFKKLCLESGLPVYDQKTHQGFFRHLVLREGVNTHQMMINLSVSNENLSDEKGETQLREQFLEKIKADSFLQDQVSTMIISYNNGLADVVNNPETEIKTFWWEGSIYEKLFFTQKEGECEAIFRIWPSSFFQTNTLGAEKLYAKVQEYSSFSENAEEKPVIYDLYSGTGTITQLMSKVAKQAIGVEIVEEAVDAAKENAKENHVENCIFYAGDVLKVLEAGQGETELPYPDFIIVDPPRDGMHKKALEKIISYGVKRLVYVACKPKSLARDLEALQNDGYKVQKLCAVDMFPRTNNCEVVALLEKEES